MDPFIGEIIMFGGNFAPRGWALCNGQLIPISQNQALFSILGTTFGGDGRTTFGLPDLRGRVPMHPGSGSGLTTRRLGEKAGAETVQLTNGQMPSHNHTVNSNTTTGTGASPENSVIAGHANAFLPTGRAKMLNTMVDPEGNDEAHPNVQPFQCVNFIIALQGVFPSRS